MIEGADVQVNDTECPHDDDGRLTKSTDWIDGTDGVQYAYDEFDRLTKLTDYDGSHLDYSYDTQGRVTSMNDYHGNTTAYAYGGDGRLAGNVKMGKGGQETMDVPILLNLSPPVSLE